MQMATHAIGPGTRNLSVNVPCAEAAAMGRAALAADELDEVQHAEQLAARSAERLAEIDPGLQP